MLLIEALTLRSAGGAGLLVHLTREMNKRNIAFRVLANASLEHFRLHGDVVFYDASWRNATQIFVKSLAKMRDVSSVFYFGNYPPRKKINLPTFTNFQNLHLLDIESEFLGGWKWELKKKYLKWNIYNSDYFIFPTKYVTERFIDTYKVQKNRCLTIPYFEQLGIEEWKNKNGNFNKKEKDSFIYVSSASAHKNHERLLDAWDILATKNLFPKLKLTLRQDERSKMLNARIAFQNKENGTKIENISRDGFLPYEETLAQTNQCQFTIFPSLLETFGFGHIEGAMLGNIVLAADLPHVRPVISPSYKFDAYSALSIAQAVERAMKTTNHPPSILHFKDEVAMLIDVLQGSLSNG